MESEAAINILRAHEADLKKLGIKKLYLFGSTARRDQRPDSDVDLFFDYDPGTIGLTLIDIKDAAARILGCKTDIMSRNSLDRHIRHYAEAEAEQVF